MSESETPLPPQAQASAPYGVLVPCPPQEFADFISRLLGKPQISEGRFPGPFTVTLNDVENFYFLIQQRIKEQNIGQLVQFTVSVKFDDGTSVELQSLEYLRAYTEVKPVVSTGVTLTWVYIVTFTHTSVPERQQIDVNIDTFVDNTRHMTSRFPFPMAEINFRYYEPHISFRISYTARTWGADIENLLKDHIKGMIIEERSSFRKFIRRRKNYLLNLLAISGIAIFLRLGNKFGKLGKPKTTR